MIWAKNAKKRLREGLFAPPLSRIPTQLYNLNLEISKRLASFDFEVWPRRHWTGAWRCSGPEVLRERFQVSPRREAGFPQSAREGN